MSKESGAAKRAGKPSLTSEINPNTTVREAAGFT